MKTVGPNRVSWVRIPPPPPMSTKLQVGVSRPIGCRRSLVDQGPVSFFQNSARKESARDLIASTGGSRELREDKDEFLRAAYHHISNPLGAIVGFSEMLRDRSRDISAGVRNEVIELLTLQAQETARLVDDLLVTATIDLSELEITTGEVDLRMVVESATSEWASRQRSRLTVSGNSKARADQHWVTHIVRNLLRNAVSFGGDNISVRITEGHHRVVLEVMDDGAGVSPEDVEQIFDPYHTRSGRSSSDPSLGLGLFVGRRLARAMGGDVQYMREDGMTVFELSLPRVSLQTSSWEPMPDVVIDPMEGRPTQESVSRIVDTGGPEMVYQPIMDLRAHRVGDSRTIGYESLARFPFSTPPVWFEMAGSLGMRLDLELAAITAAIAGFAPSNHDGFLALNLSDTTLTSSRLVESLDGLDPGRIVLELSEVAAIKSYEATRRHVDALRDAGIRLAVDDVGSGEIDLWQILRLEPAVIKIDMCLVRDIEHTPRNRALIRGMAAMAQDLGTMVIAEGVESTEEEEQLLHLGVEYGQGYLLGKPRALQWKTRVLQDVD